MPGYPDRSKQRSNNSIIGMSNSVGNNDKTNNSLAGNSNYNTDLLSLLGKSLYSEYGSKDAMEKALFGLTFTKKL
jgi:hypothetical protein